MADEKANKEKIAMADADVVLTTLKKCPEKERSSLAMAINAYLEGYMAGKQNTAQKINKIVADI